MDAKKKTSISFDFWKTENPSWGPDLSELNMADITTYVKPKTDKKVIGMLCQKR